MRICTYERKMCTDEIRMFKQRLIKICREEIKSLQIN